MEITVLGSFTIYRWYTLAHNYVGRNIIAVHKIHSMNSVDQTADTDLGFLLGILGLAFTDDAAHTLVGKTSRGLFGGVDRSKLQAVGAQVALMVQLSGRNYGGPSQGVAG